MCGSAETVIPSRYRVRVFRPDIRGTQQMVFSSLVFLCIFLPVVFCLHCLVRPIAAKNVLLIIASLLFYAFGEPVYVLLLIASAFLNYLFAAAMGEEGRKPVLIAAVIVNIGILGVFKYAGFLVDTVNTVACLSLPVPQIKLPIGISFFTFQALSYVIDVYNGQCKVQRNFFKVLLYISLFPQLIAGPIVKYRDIEAEIDSRQVVIPEAAAGLRRFVFGLSKKVLVANTMAVAADAVFASETGSMHAAAAWVGAVAYALQIYFDFSGYSDMAIGMGRMFGFHFKENFNFPYTSSSIGEYWRRWHISLGSFFRDYLFFVPIFGKRRQYASLFLVWFCTGLWHGANWTFVIFGLYHGLFIFLEGKNRRLLKKVPNGILHVYTLLVVVIGHVIFRSDSLTYAFQYIGRMFSGFNGSAVSLSLALQQLTPFFLAVLAAAIFFSGPFRGIAERLHLVPGAKKGKKGAAVQEAGRTAEGVLYVLAFALLVWCLIRLSGGSYNPFIYFQF